MDGTDDMHTDQEVDHEHRRGKNQERNWSREALWEELGRICQLNGSLRERLKTGVLAENSSSERPSGEDPGDDEVQLKKIQDLELRCEGREKELDLVFDMLDAMCKQHERLLFAMDKGCCYNTAGEPGIGPTETSVNATRQCTIDEAFADYTTGHGYKNDFDRIQDDNTEGTTCMEDAHIQKLDVTSEQNASSPSGKSEDSEEITKPENTADVEEATTNSLSDNEMSSDRNECEGKDVSGQTVIDEDTSTFADEKVSTISVGHSTENSTSREQTDAANKMKKEQNSVGLKCIHNSSKYKETYGESSKDIPARGDISTNGIRTDGNSSCNLQKMQMETQTTSEGQSACSSEADETMATGKRASTFAVSKTPPRQFLEDPHTKIGQVRYVKKDFWRQQGDKEKYQATIETASILSTGKYPRKFTGTVFCLDTSTSMIGEPLQQMKNFVCKYLEFSQQETEGGRYQEMIAIVVFGRRTKLLHSYSADYPSLTRCVKSLSAGGPSPLYGGFLLSTRIAEAGSCYQICKTLHYEQRVFLITDGQPSRSDLLAGPEVTQTVDMLEGQNAAMHVGHALAENHLELNVLPVGHASEDFLRLLAKESRGYYIEDEVNCNQAIRRLRNSTPACAIIEEVGSNPIVMQRLISILEIPNEDQIYDESDLEDMMKTANDCFDLFDDQRDMSYGNDSKVNIELGTRVCRGPSWKDGDTEDGGGPGTVIGHRPAGNIRVWWDNGKHGIYEYNITSQYYQVVQINDVRELKPHEKIAAGCFVKRGRDWFRRNEDGGEGSVGIVLRVEVHGVIRVFWPNGHVGRYRFGHCNYYDVVICDSAWASGAFKQARTGWKLEKQTDKQIPPKTTKNKVNKNATQMQKKN